MKHRTLVLVFPLLLVFVKPLARGHGPSRSSQIFSNYIAVANRGGGTVSLVNPYTYKPVSYTLQDKGEPMYFVFLPRTLTQSFSRRPAEIWVGDRANNRLEILLLKGDKIINDGFLQTPRGLFHSMTTQRFTVRRPFAATTCDIDNVTVIHDISARKELCVMQRPPQVAKLGGKPHDVTIDDKFAYVTYLGNSDGAGYVASYFAKTCKLITFIKTADDPHVAVRPGTKLFIAAQGGEVLTRTVPWLDPLTNDSTLITPHGIFISYDNRFVYVISIGTMGKNAIHVFDQSTGRRIECPKINTRFPVPHNPALSWDNRKLYLTHSITGKSINSAWDIDRTTGCVKPGTEKIFETGAMPFGIAVIPPIMRSRRFMSRHCFNRHRKYNQI